MRPLSLRDYAVRITLCVVGLCALLIISPGIGTSAGEFGLMNVWRAKLGLEISDQALLKQGWADADRSGQISADERRAFIATAREIGFGMRLNRSLLALQVGITLALCGATFQVLFRNPLATPYTLGIASGGSLGALIAIKAGWIGVFMGVPTMTVAAFLAGVAVVIVIAALARGSMRLTSNEVLLAGITLGLFCSAMMMVVTLLSSERETFRIVRWMMGSLDTISPDKNIAMLPLLLPAWVVLIAMSRALNQYRLGDELAATRGVHVARLQWLAVMVSTLAIAAVVAVCGPIGFVGLVVPHMAALVFGADCRVLLPASALIGAGFLIICDWVSQMAMPWAGALIGKQLGSASLPIGVVTAVIGVPLFLLLLVRRTRGKGD